MTHHNQSALRGLINELLNGDEELPRGEAMRRLLETSLQELIEAEVTARITASDEARGRLGSRRARRTRRGAFPVFAAIAAPVPGLTTIVPRPRSVMRTVRVGPPGIAVTWLPSLRLRISAT